MDEFEFDEAKSKANQDKHGIDFVAAQKLWQDPYLLEVRAKSDDEPCKALGGCRHTQGCPYSSDFGQAFPQEGG